MKNKLVISLLAILVFVLGLFAYIMSSDNFATNKTYEREITKTETISESDSTTSIEEDLEDTDLENLDAELSLIEAELN